MENTNISTLHNTSTLPDPASNIPTLPNTSTLSPPPDMSILLNHLENLTLSVPTPPFPSLPPMGQGIMAWVEDLPFYDEVYDSSGTIRFPYLHIIGEINKIQISDPDRIRGFPEKSLRDFKKDNRLYHIPRMLSVEEHHTIRAGVDQRARTIAAFLQDHYSTEKSLYQQHKIIPRKVVRQMVMRSSEQKVNKVFPTNHWAFWYGPDIIRGPDGSFYVCEDNIGYVGGFGDLICARNSLLNTFPEFQNSISGPDPKKFYTDIAENYRKIINSDEKIILLHYPTRMTADHEENRVKNIFRKLGIISVVVPMPSRRKRQEKKKLVVSENGVFLEVEKRKKNICLSHKVGLVIIDAEPFDVDPRDTSVKQKMVLDEARYWLNYYKESYEKISPTISGKKSLYRAEMLAKYEHLNQLLTEGGTRIHKVAQYLRRNRREDFEDTLNQGVVGLLDAYFLGKVRIVNGPGLDFIGDKLFCTYMDTLIRFYLHEEPLLKTIPTLSFGIGMTPSLKYSEIPKNISEPILGDFIPENLEKKEEEQKNISEPILGDFFPEKIEKKEERRAAKEERRNEREERKAQRKKQKEEKLQFRVERKEQKKNKGEQLDRVLLSQVFDNPEIQRHVVLKRVDGRGGDAVWVGPKISREEFLQVRPLIEQEPQAFIVQKYLSLSQVDGQLVDIRCLANVSPEGIIVSDTFWGRGVPADGSNGKVNISDRGFEFCVAVAEVLS